MIKVELISGTHSRLEGGGRVRYYQGDVLEIPIDEYKNFSNKFKVLVREEEQKSTEETQITAEEEFNPEDYISHYGGGYFSVEGLEDNVRGRDKAIEKVKELRGRGEL